MKKMVEDLSVAATITWRKVKRKLMDVNFALGSDWRLIYANTDFCIIQFAKKIHSAIQK
jgi:hypothetical protein